MPRLNLYEQQTTAQGPRASGADFGAAPAQAIEGMGNELQVIGNRIQERENLSDRQRLRETFEEVAVPMLNDFDKNPEISSKESIPRFRQALEQKRQELISKHVGNPESRAKLENSLDNLVSQYTKRAIGAKINADQQLMVRTMNQQFEKSALDADAAPDIWSFAKDENLMLVEEMRPGMSQDQYVAAKRLAYAKPLQSAVKSHIAQGNWEAAWTIMRDENFSKFLTAQEAIPLRIDVAVGRGKMEKEEREIEGTRKALSYLLGTEATREQAVTVSGLASMPFAQKLNVLKMMNGGNDLPQTTIDKVMGLERQNSESKVQQITDLAMNYDTLDVNGRMKLGLLIKSEFRDINGVDQYGNPTRYSTVPAELQRFVDPTGGRPGSGGVITGSVATGAGNDNKSSGYNGGSSSAAASEQLAIMQRERENPANSPEDNAALDREIARVRGSSDQQAPAGDNVDDDVVDLYANYDKMTGLEAFVKRNAANLPLNIGDRLKINPAYGKAAMASEVLTNDIVRGFISMGEGKDTVANQYRQELKKIVSIEPKLIGSDREYLFKLQTISKELKQRRNEYQKIAETGATKDMRTASIAAVATITKILSRIPIPEKVVNSDEEFAKLKPGEVYMTSDDPRPRRKGGVK